MVVPNSICVRHATPQYRNYTTSVIMQYGMRKVYIVIVFFDILILTTLTTIEILFSFSMTMRNIFSATICIFCAEMVLPLNVNQMWRNNWLLRTDKTNSRSELKMSVVGSGLGPTKPKLVQNINGGSPLLNSHIDLLINIWQSVCLASKEKGWMKDSSEEEEFIDFVLKDYYGNGALSEENESARVRKRASGLIQHFQFCKDTCAADGVFLMATQNDEDQDLLRLSRVLNIAVSRFLQQLSNHW